MICGDHDAFEEIRDAFSVKNNAAFFSERYGYKAAEKLYAINKFGFFLPGLVFEILHWVKLHYGSLQSVAMSPRCKKFIDDHLMPLKSTLKDNFEISNISDDLGRNNELERLGKGSLEYRDYQMASIKELLFTGYGRGLIEVPTGAGKSFIIANFIWNILKHVDRNAKTLILVPNT